MSELELEPQERERRANIWLTNALQKRKYEWEVRRWSWLDADELLGVLTEYLEGPEKTCGLNFELYELAYEVKFAIEQWQTVGALRGRNNCEVDPNLMLQFLCEKMAVMALGKAFDLSLTPSG
jgi:hypothetical protein